MTKSQKGYTNMKNRQYYAQKSWEKFSAWQTAHKADVVNPYTEAGYKAEYNILADENLHLAKSKRIKVIDVMKSNARYNMSQQTALSVYRAYKEQFPDGEYKLADIRRLSTQQVAEMLDVDVYYHTLLEMGYTSKQAKMMVSATYFGS